MEHGLHDSKVDPEEKVQKRKVVDLGPIMLDAERCVLCSRCIRFERNVTGTDSFEFRNRGDHTQIAHLRGPAHHPQLRLEPGRRLPGGRAPRPTTSASRCASGSWRATRVRLPRLLHRLQHLHRPPRRRGASPPSAAQRGRQQVLDVRHRARRVQGDLARHARDRGPRARRQRLAGNDRGHRPRQGRGGHPGRARARRPSWPRPRPPTRTSTCSACSPSARGDARLPRRQPAGQGAGARGQRPPARRPQSQHHRLPGPGHRPLRRGHDPQRLRHGPGEGPRPPGGRISSRIRWWPRPRPRCRSSPSSPPTSGRSWRRPTPSCPPRCGRRWTAPSRTTSGACSGSRRRWRLRARRCRAGSSRPAWSTRLGETITLSSAREIFTLIARDVPVYSGLDHRKVSGMGRALDGPAPQEARA